MAKGYQGNITRHIFDQLRDILFFLPTELNTHKLSRKFMSHFITLCQYIIKMSAGKVQREVHIPSRYGPELKGRKEKKI